MFKRIYVLAIFAMFLLIVPKSIQAGLLELNFGSIDLMSTKIYRYNDSILIFGGINGISITKNGGVDWEEYRQSYEGINFDCFDLIDNNTILLAGQYQLQGPKLKDAVLFSLNTKTAEFKVLTEFEKFLPRIIHRTGNKISVIGLGEDLASNKSYKSYDLGLTWSEDTVAKSMPGAVIYQIQNDGFGYAIGRYGGLHTTTNNGSSWEEKKISASVNLQNVMCFSKETIIAYDTAGNIYKSKDFGSSWNKYSKIYKPEKLNLFGTAKDSVNFLYSIANGNTSSTLYISNDAGLTSKEITSGDGYKFFSLVMNNNSDAFAAGMSVEGQFFSPFGLVYKAETSSVESNTLASINSTYPNPANQTINFKIPGEGYCTIEVMNSYGELVKVLKNILYQEVISFQIEDLQQGIYFVTAKNDSILLQDKFIKE
ncbi:MAG: T9SS type A sorting domain-containing protein [Candidatus Kapabacteria bacterium]|nr:T9SS type A sorting domain-containing protein [Candidatus Kapabacteria bacterium]